MCGIHGFINGKKVNINADDYVKQGFVAGSLRGMDSSGIASIKPGDKAASWQKLPVMGSFFIGDAFAKSLMSEANKKDTITICHTRAATSGGINISTAHPFAVEGPVREDGTFRELVGVHNGTLNFWSTKKGAKDYTVDSEWALNHIFDHGADAFKDFEGAFVFVWWDSDDSEILNIALNKERPMYVGFTDNEGMAFASEPGMLDWLCARNSIKLEGPISKLSADHWYKFNVNDVSKFTKEALPAKATFPSRPQGTSQGTSQGSYSAQAYTHVGKMDELVKTINKAPINLVSDAKRRKSTVKPGEIELAKDMGWMNVRAKFRPVMTTGTGDVEGLISLSKGKGDAETEYGAVMRDGDWYKYDNNTMWDVSVIGVIDDGRNLTAVTTRPYGIVSETKRLNEEVAEATFPF